MKKLGLWLMTICLLASLSFATVACNLNSESGAKDKVELNETSISLEVYSEYTLTATSNVKGEVTWSSSDESVATVAGGKVSALKVGSATITATAGKASATCEVTVTALSVLPVLEVSDEEIQLVVGDEPYEVTASVTFKGETQDCQISWESENADVATVANGAITAVGVGSTTVTATAVCLGETLTQEINVTVSADEYITVSKGVMDLKVAEVNVEDITSDVFTAMAYVNGAEDGDKEILFRSNDENVATVVKNGNQATVTAVGVGSTTIEAYYQSEYGKIVSTVSVTVSRSQVELSESLSTPYAGADTVLDLSALDLQGEVEGVYFGGSRIDLADNKLDETFVEANKDNFVEIEIRTSAVSYTAQFIITVPFVAEVSQGAVGALMPVYEGDETALGFADGTTVYELVTTRKYTTDAESDSGYLHCKEESHVDEDGYHTHVDGWDTRLITTVGKAKDYVKFDVVFSKDVGHFTMWPANDVETKGSYDVFGQSASGASGADPDRKILVLNEKGKTESTFKANTIYTVYFFLLRGETNVQFGLFSDITAYVANIDCGNGDVNEKEPDPISQGDDRNTMPIFAGDEEALGFADGTTVYEIVGPNGNDAKLVAKVDAMTYDYAKLDFVVTANTSSVGVWITAENSHLGYYTITPTGFTADGSGDPSRDIFVTDKDGNAVTSFNANTIYTLYIGFDGREITVQLSTWANLTMYVANVACISASELPSSHTPPAVTPGEEISILFIGNSFSDDTEAYVVEILLELGYTTINVGNMYIGGCTIDMHYSNIMSNASAYDFRMRTHNGVKYTEYVPVSVGGRKQTLDFAIGYKDWDIISLQQGSALSGKADSYANLSALKAEVQNRATNPDVEFVFNMTWAYQGNSTHPNFPDYNSDQTTMYNAIVDAVQQKVDFTVVPNGTAIQNARSSFVGDTLTLDGHHLSLKLGRYIAGLTFVAKVTGKDISDIAYAPSGVTESQKLVAIESVKNALATPYAVTTSAYAKDPYAIPSDSLIQSYGTSGSVTVYNGDETALGFADGSDVYQYVGEDSGTDKALIKVDSSYDFVEVQLVITSGDGYFFMHGIKGGVYHLNGTSYVIDPGWIRLADGNNSPSDRKIEVLDANGNKVSALMANNVLYTLRVEIGDLDEILISKTGSTIYLANVKYYNEEDLPKPVVVIGQGDGSSSLPVYTGDVTALGFEEGERVQHMTTETITKEWWQGADYPDEVVDSNGKTREQLAARIPAEEGKYVTVKFATSKDVTSGGLFFVWSLLGANYSGNGEIALSGSTVGKILDKDGYAVTSISANTVYVLELYVANSDVYKVANTIKDGMVTYFAPDSITCSDSSIEKVQQTPDPEPQAPIVSGEATSTALSEYAGDVTELGFADGTDVYELVSTSLWNDRVKIAVDSTYSYAFVDFVVAEGNGWFTMWIVDASAMKSTTYLVDGYTNAASDGSATIVTVYDANGNVVTSGIKEDTVYTLCVEIKTLGLVNVQLGHDSATMYFANVNCSDDLPTPTVTPDPDPEPQAPIVSGEATSTALSKYAGDVASLGFADGTDVYELVSTHSWNDRVKIAADNSKKYLDVQFIVAEGNWWFTVWVCKASGMLDGSYLVNENTTNATYGKGFAPHLPSGNGGVGGNTRIQVLENGAVKTGGRTNGTIYTLRVWLEDENLTEIQIGHDSATMYFANVQSTDEEPVVTVVLKRYDDSALSQYDGDVTALGFEEGERVQYMVTETTENAWGTEPTSGKTREQLAAHIPGEAGKYVTIKFATNTDIPSGSVFYVWGLLGSTYTQNGGVNFTTTDKGVILDVNGYPVTSISKNTVYVLQFYIANTDTYKLSNIVSTGMELYFAPDSIECLDKPFAVEFPSASDLVQSAGSNKSAVTVYNGDVESLGFANGSKVFKYVGATTNDKIGIKVDNTYDYFDVQLVFTEGNGYMFGFAVSNGTFLNNSAAYVLDPSNVRINANGVAMDREIKVFDANGNEFNSNLFQMNTLYTLRVYVKAGDVTEFQMRQTNTTLYLANVTYGNDPAATTNVEIKKGNEKTIPTVTAVDITSLGFAEGTTVYEYTPVSFDDIFDSRYVMEVDSTKEYLAIDFALMMELYGPLNVYTVTDGGQAILVAQLLMEGGVNTDATITLIVKDAEGNDVTGEILSPNQKYTLFVYFDGADEVHFACGDYDEEWGGNTLYVADARYEA